MKEKKIRPLKEGKSFTRPSNEENELSKIQFNVKDELFKPTKAHPSDTGFDVKADIPEDSPITINRGERAFIPLGFSMVLPKGYGAELRSRSGLTLKEGLVIAQGNGTIDESYQKEVRAIILNTTNTEKFIKRGDRIAQLVIEKVIDLPVTTKIVKDLDGGDRGGFGSTGK